MFFDCRVMHSSLLLRQLCPAAIVVLALLAAGCEKAWAKIVPPEPVKVKVTLPTEQVVTEYEEFTGRTWAVNTVEIRSRVSGYLAEVKFKDGAEVQKGKEVFVVDDRS